MQRKLLILDIDETLVYGTEAPIPGRQPDFCVGPYSVYRRPYVEGFLRAVAGWFDLAIWSSATSSYVYPIASQILRDLPLRFTWASDRCTRRYDPEWQEHFYAKDLRKVCKQGYSLEQILILDDSPEKVARHYGNHIRVRPFEGDPSDTELRDILPFLDWLRAAENVRKIEKRLWREFRPPMPSK